MSFAIDELIVWKRETFVGAKNIGVEKRTFPFSNDPNMVHEHFVLSLVRPHGGQYFTSLPISPQEYRERNNCWASGFKLTAHGIDIFDDYGTRHSIGCSKAVADRLAEECVAWGLNARAKQ